MHVFAITIDHRYSSRTFLVVDSSVESSGSESILTMWKVEAAPGKFKQRPKSRNMDWNMLCLNTSQMNAAYFTVYIFQLIIVLYKLSILCTLTAYGNINM